MGKGTHWNRARLPSHDEVVTFWPIAPLPLECVVGNFVE